jgi:transcriptional regulator with XRE-family HTH domain
MRAQRHYSDTVRHATQLLGSQVRRGRIQRQWTVRQLAERAQISTNTLLKVEHGDPTVTVGIAFDVAVLVGVPLFFDDRERLLSEARRETERTALLAQRVRPAIEEPDYDF